jgi:hypothetical protein
MDVLWGTAERLILLLGWLQLRNAKRVAAIKLEVAPATGQRSMDEKRTEDIDWSLTTWEGARREQRRRWARMPLSEMIRALECVFHAIVNTVSTGW